MLNSKPHLLSKKASLSACAHLALIIASFQRSRAIKLGWVLHSVSAAPSAASRLDSALICGKLEFILPRRACKHLETVTRRSAIPEEGDKHLEVDVSEKGKRRLQPEPPLA